MTTRIVFLDRDGTINVDHGYVSRLDEWEFTERAIEGLKILKAGGYGLAIVTNQAGIAYGYYTPNDVEVLHRYLVDVLREVGLAFEAIAFCPHSADDHCECRKPRVGMARQIEKQLQQPIDYSESWMIGDKIADIEFGFTIGAKTALIRSDYWQEGQLRFRPNLVVESLYDAACHITKLSSA